MLAIAIRAGKHEEAFAPAEGWPAFAGLAGKTWRDAIALIERAELARRANGVISLTFRANWYWGDALDSGYVRVPPAILGVAPDARRAWLACLTLAHFKTGRSLATETTIARRMGRSRTRATRLVDVLIAADAFHRVGRRGWRVRTARKGEAVAFLPSHILEDFGFDMRPRHDDAPGEAELFNAELVGIATERRYAHTRTAVDAHPAAVRAHPAAVDAHIPNDSPNDSPNDRDQPAAASPRPAVPGSRAVG